MFLATYLVSKYIVKSFLFALAFNCCFKGKKTGSAPFIDICYRRDQKGKNPCLVLSVGEDLVTTGERQRGGHMAHSGLHPAHSFPVTSLLPREAGEPQSTGNPHTGHRREGFF